MRYSARVGARTFAIAIEPLAPGRYRVVVDGTSREVGARAGSGGALLIDLDARRHEAIVTQEESGAGAADGAAGTGARTVVLDGREHRVLLADPLRAAVSTSAAAATGPTALRAVMPGRVAAVLVREGDSVEAGQGLVVIEAMKMENEMRAPRQGRITAVRVRAGDTVEAGAPLVEIG